MVRLVRSFSRIMAPLGFGPPLSDRGRRRRLLLGKMNGLYRELQAFIRCLQPDPMTAISLSVRAAAFRSAGRVPGRALAPCDARSGNGRGSAIAELDPWRMGTLVRVLQPTSPRWRAPGTPISSDLRALGSVLLSGGTPPEPLRRETSVAPSNSEHDPDRRRRGARPRLRVVIVQGQPEAAFCSGEEISPCVRLDTVERDRIVIVRNGVREAVFMKDAEGGAVGVAALPPPIVSRRHRPSSRRPAAIATAVGSRNFLNQALIVPNPDGGFPGAPGPGREACREARPSPGDVIKTSRPAAHQHGRRDASLPAIGTAQRVLVDVQRQAAAKRYYDCADGGAIPRTHEKKPCNRRPNPRRRTRVRRTYRFRADTRTPSEPRPLPRACLPSPRRSACPAARLPRTGYDTASGRGRAQFQARTCRPL